MLEEEKKIKFINEKIAQLKVYIKLNTKINLNDISIISENFFCKLLNIIFDYQLINANIFENNFLAVDLIDEKNKVVIQVTSDKSADKIQKTIEKFQTKFDNSYKLKFVIINDKKTYRKKFNIDSSYDFDIKKDVIFIEDFSQLARKNVDAIYDVIINEFFWENIERQYEWFETNNRNNIEDLGCRYNKEIDITTETYRKLENFLVDKDSLMKILLKIKKLIYSLNEFENKLVKKDKIEELKFNYLKFIKEIKIIDVDKLHCNLVDIEKNINENKESVINNLSNDGDNYTEKRKIYSIIDQCEECKDELKLVEKKVLIITGDMGTGKSHILASYIENISLKKKYETILILGQHLNDNKLFKLQIKEILEINEEFERFIKLLNAKGKEKNIIVPIFIDAINESLYNSKWKDELNSLINIMKSYKYVKLVITLRSDYIQRCLPEKIEKEDYVEIIEHNGFRDEDDIYAIISEIFHYYGVPIPVFPMINDEYTNPLFIISLCKWVRDYNIDILVQDYTSFRTIFEEYISMINKRMANKFNYNEDNHLLNDIIKKIVEYMIENNKIYIVQSELCNIIRDLLLNYGIAPIRFIDELKSEGLIFKSLYIKDEIIYFSYEQYISILKAKLLLDRIKKDSVIDIDKLKLLLEEEKDLDVLKNIFVSIGNEYGIEVYDLFNFNEDIKNKNYLMSAYISSLLWRKKSNFDKNSNFIEFINIVSKDYSWIMSDYIDLFYYCSSIEDSPFNIYNYNIKLKEMSLTERDFKFTIRLNHENAVRIALYCLKADMKDLKKENRIMLAITLSWFLSTPNRYLRDISTKALVNLLTNNVETMIKLIDNFKNVDDLYILERIYASCYGAVLRSDNYKGLEKLLENVYENIFDVKEVLPNIIIRYYAKNLILYGKYKNCDIKFELDKIYPPYNSKWYKILPTNDEIKNYKIEFEKIDKKNRYLYAQNEIIDSMLTEDAKELGMYGDFGRYYFGANISNWKQNFESEQVLSNIAIKRVFDFGYDVRKFGNFDMRQRELEGYDRHGHRYERIGKKYQWLAMYEILAKLQDNYKCLKYINKEDENIKKGEKYYSWNGENVDFSQATYKEQIYEECDIDLLNIDVTNLIDLPKAERRKKLNINVDESWFKEDISDIESIIEKDEFISLSASKRFENRTLDLYEIKGLWEDDKYDSEMTIVYQAYIYVNKLDLDEEEKEGMFRGITYKDKNFLLLEYPWKCESREEYNANRKGCYITNYDYNYNTEYDMTENDNSSIIQPSKYIVDILNLKQGNNGYWYDKNNNIVCFDTILENGEKEFIIKKDVLMDMLKSNKLKIMWMGYIEKKYMDNLREYRFRIDIDENGKYILTKKWSEQEWKYRF